MNQSHVFRLGVIGLLAVLGGADPLYAGEELGRAWSVQVPYEGPPANPDVPDVSIPPNTTPLGPEELKRAETLLPLLEGKQEFWAMGEFVHLGESSVPVLIKALTMPSPRIRYNAIETLLMMKGWQVCPLSSRQRRSRANCHACGNMRYGWPFVWMRPKPPKPSTSWPRIPIHQ